ncbi:hypothetical protein CEUSTIGMA_g4300.t1 [Chlamydomonas eustigma]|uniref:Uncharacterized protein n=1 Tax=Chlamydomonas eustigma TaxID=1157962 RepID=A0A250X176_9CHLO|nr:hypothetical protein CEUSTIGMA_g4300.t1 [Chlamydomonas eustigma]|eukprot:GAX76854.1 hypothetical protein CEUSTIGMA_g4300.t1 [Chlamydomonas eustigma]
MLLLVEDRFLPPLHEAANTILVESKERIGTSSALNLIQFLAFASEVRSFASASLLLTNSLHGGIENSSESGGSQEAEHKQQKQHVQVSKACLRVLAAVSRVESAVLSDELVYKTTKGETEVLMDRITDSIVDRVPKTSHEVDEGTLSRGVTDLHQLLIQRLSLDGYHPLKGGSTLSVILSREEKKAYLDELRKEQALMIEDVRRILYSPSYCVEVEIPEDEFSTDPLIAWLVNKQQSLGLKSSSNEQEVDRYDGAALRGSVRSLDAGDVHTRVLRLDLEAAQQLLLHHTDQSVRRQTYQAAVLSRCQAVFQRMDTLAELRRKIAACYDMESYFELGKVLGGNGVGESSNESLRLLLRVAESLKDGAGQKLKSLRITKERFSTDDVHPWDLDWLHEQQRKEFRQTDGELITVRGDQLGVGEVMQGLSSYLHRLMGVTLHAWPHGFEGTFSDCMEQGGVPNHGEAGSLPGALYDLLQSFSTCSGAGTGVSSCHPPDYSGLTQSVDAAGDAAEQVADAAAITQRFYVYNVNDGSGKGSIGTILIDSKGGYGTHFLSKGSQSMSWKKALENGVSPSCQSSSAPASSRFKPEAFLSSTSSSCGDSEVLGPSENSQGSSLNLPVVVVGLNWRGAFALEASSYCSLDADEMGHSVGKEPGMCSLEACMARQSAAVSLMELMHEMGHALHFLLSIAGMEDVNTGFSTGMGGHMIQAGGPSSSVNLGRKCQYAMYCCPSTLPVQLVEIHSSLFERMVMSPQCLAEILPSSFSYRWVEELSQLASHAMYDPLGYQIQVLTMIMDQLMCCRSSSEEGLACDVNSQESQLLRELATCSSHEIWSSLCDVYLPDLNTSVTFNTVQQANALMRVVENGGTAGGYVKAWWTAGWLWEGLGLDRDPLNAEAGAWLKLNLFSQHLPSHLVQIQNASCED